MWPLETIVKMNEEAKYQASKEGGWHPIDHCLPVDDRDILFFDEEQNYWVGFLEKGKFYDSTGICDLHGITHWRELTPPPKERK